MTSRVGSSYIALLVCALTLAAGCGSQQFVQVAQPPPPIQLAAVVTPRSMSLEPGSVGAGPTDIIASNQSGGDLTLALQGPNVNDKTGPVHPRDAAKLHDALSPGTYQLIAVASNGTQQSATLSVGPKRQSGATDVSQP